MMTGRRSSLRPAKPVLSERSESKGSYGAASSLRIHAPLLGQSLLAIT